MLVGRVHHLHKNVIKHFAMAAAVWHAGRKARVFLYVGQQHNSGTGEGRGARGEMGQSGDGAVCMDWAQEKCRIDGASAVHILSPFLGLIQQHRST